MILRGMEIRKDLIEGPSSGWKKAGPCDSKNFELILVGYLEGNQLHSLFL
jgi:hypothetical protein